MARLRTETFLCCALSTAFLVSLTGVIGFVGLMVPYLARRLVGVRHRLAVPMCGLLGATLLTGGDMLSRSLIPNQELPIGIITAGLGARSSCPCCCARNDERAPCEDKVVYQKPAPGAAAGQSGGLSGVFGPAFTFAGFADAGVEAVGRIGGAVERLQIRLGVVQVADVMLRGVLGAAPVKDLEHLFL